VDCLKTTIDILDRLEEEKGYVRLVLTSGEIVFGIPQCIVYDEDEDGWETIKTIMFDPCGGQHSVFYKAEDIKSYDNCKEEDIPPYE